MADDLPVHVKQRIDVFGLPPKDGKTGENSKQMRLRDDAKPAVVSLKTVGVAHEGRSTSTPWSIIVVFLVAAGGLLWLLLKRRA